MFLDNAAACDRAYCVLRADRLLDLGEIQLPKPSMPELKRLANSPTAYLMLKIVIVAPAEELLDRGYAIHAPVRPHRLVPVRERRFRRYLEPGPRADVGGGRRLRPRLSRAASNGRVFDLKGDSHADVRCVRK
jgi:hypothetical protein